MPTDDFFFWPFHLESSRQRACLGWCFFSFFANDREIVLFMRPLIRCHFRVYRSAAPHIGRKNQSTQRGGGSVFLSLPARSWTFFFFVLGRLVENVTLRMDCCLDAFKLVRVSFFFSGVSLYFWSPFCSGSCYQVLGMSISTHHDPRMSFFFAWKGKGTSENKERRRCEQFISFFSSAARPVIQCYRSTQSVFKGENCTVFSLFFPPWSSYPTILRTLPLVIHFLRLSRRGSTRVHVRLFFLVYSILHVSSSEDKWVPQLNPLGLSPSPFSRRFFFLLLWCVRSVVL